MVKARKSSAKAKRPGGAPAYEDVRSRLEAVVAKLERGEGTLEESLALYEEGVGLVRSAHGMLDTAEKRLEVLKPQADGSFRLEDRTAEMGAAGEAAGADPDERNEYEGDIE